MEEARGGEGECDVVEGPGPGCLGQAVGGRAWRGKDTDIY